MAELPDDQCIQAGHTKCSLGWSSGVLLPPKVSEAVTAMMIMTIVEPMKIMMIGILLLMLMTMLTIVSMMMTMTMLIKVAMMKPPG